MEGGTLTLLDAFTRYRTALQLSEDELSRETWYRWVRDGRVPTIKLLSGRKRVRAAELDALITSGGVPR